MFHLFRLIETKLIHELEELEGKLEMHSKSDILLPEIRLKKQFKADGSLELDLVLAIASVMISFYVHTRSLI